MRIIRGITRKGCSSDVDEPPHYSSIIGGLLTWFIVISFVIWLGLSMCPHSVR